MSGGRPGGSRRWTLLLALLAIVVVVGAALRAGDVEPRVEDVDAPDAGAPLDGPLLIELARAPSIDGSPSDVVRALGPVQLDSQSNLPYATSRLGEPDESGPSQDDPNYCRATWGEYALEVWFHFGHPPSPEASCSQGPVDFAVMRGAQWRVEPLGLSIGDPRSAIEAAAPDAQQQVLEPAFAQVVDSTEAYVLATGSYGGTRSPILRATIDDDRIEAFVYVSAAD